MVQACTFHPIGILHTPFREKFGIPRQPGLVPEAQGRLVMLPPYDNPAAFKGIEGYSHLWLQFLFHRCLGEGWQPQVRPPRLGGNRRVGVFASRSPYRPNPVGLSVVGLESLDVGQGRVSLLLSGVDMLDGTPVLDIKPYLPYADSVPNASGGFAPQAPEVRLRIGFSPRAEAQVAERRDLPRLRPLIVRLLELDPRPAYRGDESGRCYGMRLYDFDLRWRVDGERVEVLELAVPEA